MSSTGSMFITYPAAQIALVILASTAMNFLNLSTLMDVFDTQIIPITVTIH